MMKSQGFLNAFQLKMVMAALMVLDHLYNNLFPQYLEWGHVAARVVAPMFAFLVAEGLVHTRSRERYIGRMLGFGAGMLAANILLHTIFGTLEISVIGILTELGTYSIFLSLGLGAAIVYAADRAREASGTDKTGWILLVIGLFIAVMFFEGSFMMPFCILIFYYLRRNRLWMCAAYVVLFSVMFLPAYFSTGLLPTQFYMVFAVVPILLYNGQRGMDNGFSKYFFYVFYPLHIWIIYIAEQIAGK